MRFFAVIAVAAGLCALPLMSAPNRILRPLNNSESRIISGNVHRLAVAGSDLGEVNPALKLDHVLMLIRPSDTQQADLDQFLRDQQNPSSPDYRRWLTPEEYADRFGLSVADHSGVVSWLTSQGLTVEESSRGRNWVAFSGSAAQVSKALRTSIHRYQARGETHFANATAPRVPAAMADLVGGFIGLNDFTPRPLAKVQGPANFTSGSSHYLAPGDWMTIYNVSPLAAAGLDGAGQSIAVVGQSSILASDIAAFRSDFGLPVNAVRLVPYGSDPGFNGAQIEGNLDVEWSGAIAPRATIYYVYGTNAFTAVLYAVSQNIAPVISVSYGICENDSLPAYRNIAQQANAQGITITVASGDSGAGGCDYQSASALAAHGPLISFPGNLPEVTSMGGTMFQEGSGIYWGAKNALSGGSALGYIPEIAWNESNIAGGLAASGGGPSALIEKPVWQSGPGVPADGARDTPDISVASAGHDGYLVTYQGNNLYVIGGTSAAAPTMAGLLALLNQYVVKQGIQKSPGLGNINPQLYRMAQTVPAAFHDITGGSNIVPCVQGSPGCLTGSYGWAAAPGYDLATGLGSIDANVLFRSWGQATNPVVITASLSAPSITMNDTLTITATVAAAKGEGTPTGTVNFTCNAVSFGSAQLVAVDGRQTAAITLPGYLIASCTAGVSYSGDGAFSAGGITVPLKITLPVKPGVSGIFVSIPGPVFATQTGNQPLTWQPHISVSELAGVPAVLTGFTFDGVTQELWPTFLSTAIPPGKTLTAAPVLKNLGVPSTHVFGFTGTDLGGNTWTRQIPVAFRGPEVQTQVNFNLWGSPLTIEPFAGTPDVCRYSQRITLDEITGYELHIVAVLQGSVDITSSATSLFGTTRLAPWGSLSGTLCWRPAVAPSSDVLQVVMSDDFGDQIFQELNVNFAAPTTSRSGLSVSPSSVSILPPVWVLPEAPATFSVNLTDQTQPWTATVFPANRTTSWLRLSQYAGTGSATVTLTASASGFAPGAYRATVLLQSPHSTPQWLEVPVMWVNAERHVGPSVSSVGNAISFTPRVSPGALMSIYGERMSEGTQAASGLPLTYSLVGTAVTVNGWPAPILYASPSQINVQVPYEVGAGPAVLGINNNGKIGGFLFPISPSAPAILSVEGDLYPRVSVKRGAYVTMYVTGAGELSQALPSGVAASGGASALPVPRLPMGVSVGGVPALIQFAGATPGVVGLVQVNFVVPAEANAGVQPVGITVGGYPSVAANIVVVE